MGNDQGCPRSPESELHLLWECVLYILVCSYLFAVRLMTKPERVPSNNFCLPVFIIFFILVQFLLIFASLVRLI